MLCITNLFKGGAVVIRWTVGMKALTCDNDWMKCGHEDLMKWDDE